MREEKLETRNNADASLRERKKILGVAQSLKVKFLVKIEDLKKIIV